MDIVKLNVYAEAYYSGATYEEDVVISKNLYEKIKTELDEYDSENNENASGIYVGELDGKHSEVEGDLSVEIYSEDEVGDYSWDLNEDEDSLYYKVKDICDEKNLDLDKDIENVKEYLKNIDSYVEICIRTKKSNVDKIKEYAESLEQK